MQVYCTAKVQYYLVWILIILIYYRENCIEKHYEKINLLYFSKVQDKSARLQPAQLS